MALTWDQMEVADSPELQRVLSVPRRKPLEHGSVEAKAMVRLMTARFRFENASCNCRQLGRECITELREVQAWALFELIKYGGILGLIGVGFGKTLLDILALKALEPRGHRVGCLLVPPSLLGQLVEDYTHISQHFAVPDLRVHGSGDLKGLVIRAQGTSTLHVFPYSRLQRANYATWVANLAPDVIIADEADYLSDPSTASTSRVIRALIAKPGTVFLCWSGSITDTSIRDYWHLSCFALRENSPLPLKKEVVDDWCRALDPVDDKAPDGALSQLRTEPGQTLYDAFYGRLVETPGVIHTTLSSIDTPIDIKERTVNVSPLVEQALRTLRKDWVRPDHLAPGYVDGAPCEEFMTALEVNACAIQLACGFFYRWKYPRGEPEALIREWLEARSLWQREVRRKLQDRVDLLDSELLCREAAMRHHGDLPKNPRLPEWQSLHWPRWRDVQGKVQPETEEILVDDFLAVDAANWAADNRGIVWYESRAFGRRVAELSGVPLYGGGPKSESIVTEKGDRSIVASLRSHGRGRNGLQRIFSTQLVAQPPSSPARWEQLLGRLSRPEQKAASVEAWFYRHTDELDRYVTRALARAEYVRGTTGASQRILQRA